MDTKGTESQKLNLYSYSKNNPVRYIDPTGEDAMDYMIRLTVGLASGESPIKAHAAASVMSQNLDTAKMSPTGQIIANTVRVGINELTPLGAATKVFGGVDPYTGQATSFDSKAFEVGKSMISPAGVLTSGGVSPSWSQFVSDAIKGIELGDSTYEATEANDPSSDMNFEMPSNDQTSNINGGN